VVDRQSKAGLETSYANGGQVSVSHAEPWAKFKTDPDARIVLLRGLSPKSI